MTLGVILHVEDDDNWIEIIKKLLQDKKPNLIIQSAKSLKEARLLYGDFLLTGHVPELVILDISLVMENKNDKSGIEFAETLISFGLTEKTSIIILSENVNIENLVELFRKYKTTVADVFRKGEFRDEIDRFVETVLKCLEKPNYKIC
ncbi:MAG: hypothetical protein H6654_07040 [Ardenticatenaceae bacterium]|nr:hypothetical protein [Anaerolineales bacterium]MCB8940280.1 hypothetical protein [Ardenticatenaceae bacterium]MCB8973295.1 hypothetical protein [Ardenticatenaceae bacterium]